VIDENLARKKKAYSVDFTQAGSLAVFVWVVRNFVDGDIGEAKKPRRKTPNAWLVLPPARRHCSAFLLPPPCDAIFLLARYPVGGPGAKSISGFSV
jgi:hypothetical protein